MDPSYLLIKAIPLRQYHTEESVLRALQTGDTVWLAYRTISSIRGGFHNTVVVNTSETVQYLVHSDSLPTIQYLQQKSLAFPMQKSHSEVLQEVVRELQLSPHLGRIFAERQEYYAQNGTFKN